VIREIPYLGCLYDEHGEQDSAIDQRHAEKRPVRILAGFRKVLEPRVPGHVADCERPQLLSHKPGKAFTEVHPYAADALGPKANRGGQPEIRAVGLEQINGTHVGLETLLNESCDIHERFARISAGRESIDVFGRPHERAFLHADRFIHHRAQSPATDSHEMCTRISERCKSTILSVARHSILRIRHSLVRRSHSRVRRPAVNPW
jgi:hypothetical protein